MIDLIIILTLFMISQSKNHYTWFEEDNKYIKIIYKMYIRIVFL